MTVLRSRDNPRLRRWRRLVADPRLRRREGCALIEGPHLIAACLQAGVRPEALILSESGAARAEMDHLVQQSGIAATILTDLMFAALAGAESPQGIAAEIRMPPEADSLEAAAACVFLDGIQDAGNVGAILRSAAAFGVPVAVLGPGCADAWSPKVLRAAMGAHFSIGLRRSDDLAADLERFGGRIACAVPRGGVPPGDTELSGRLGWILGAEGQGVSDALASRAPVKVTIPIRSGTESLNVAAAAAILFYEASRVRKRGAPA